MVPGRLPGRIEPALLINKSRARAFIRRLLALIRGHLVPAATVNCSRDRAPGRRDRGHFYRTRTSKKTSWAHCPGRLGLDPGRLAHVPVREKRQTEGVTAPGSGKKGADPGRIFGDFGRFVRNLGPWSWAPGPRSWAPGRFDTVPGPGGGACLTRQKKARQGRARCTR